MRTIALAWVALACANDPVAIGKSSNPAISVELLFEHDGCQVNRFYDDGYYHYYARCKSGVSTEADWYEPCGKGCTKERHETIETIETKDGGRK